MSNWTEHTNLRRFQNIGLQRGLVFGVIILTALIAFEAFNFSTTQYALSDLLGNLTFAGFRWATILSIAFCGIDFAGIARLFSPSLDPKGPNEVWYLFGAWLLAATMNSVLTWWGVSIALINHQTQSSAVIDPGIVMHAVPIVVAVMVWLIRILIIGSFSIAGDRIFSIENGNSTENQEIPHPTMGSNSYPYRTNPTQAASFSGPNQPSRSDYIPSHRPVWPSGSSVMNTTASGESRLPMNDPSPSRGPNPASSDRGYSRPEPTYHEISAAPKPNDSNGNRKLQ